MEIQEFISFPICTQYGSVGSVYTQVLVARPEIESIGEYLYRIDRKEIHVPDELRIRFGEECEKYRCGLRDKMPSLCYCGDDLGIYPEDLKNDK